MTRDARYDILFEPVKIGPVTAKNRFFQVPHCNGMGFRDATSNAVMRQVKAEGGWAVISTEQTEIHPTGDIAPFIELHIWDDQDVPMLARIADAIHSHGSLAALELCHNGMNAGNLYSREVPLGPAHLPVATAFNDPVQARAMDKEDIRNLRRWHRNAALRAKRAGYDIAYVYAGKLFGGAMYFISRRYNERTDEYGGSLENRSRLLRELIEDTKEAVGDSMGVVCRISVDELLGDEGLHAAEARDMVAMMAELPDCWDLTLSGWENDSQTSRFAAEAYQEPFVTGLKQLTTKPVVGVGRFTSPDTMVRMVKSGILDLIGAARPSIADPFLPKKIEEGRIEDIRECIGCNMCVAGDFTQVPSRCTQNPSFSEEWRKGWHPERIRPRHTDARVLVVGSGPAGLEASMMLGRRGYHVTLAEASGELGGRVAGERKLPGLSAWGRVADYRIGQIGSMANVEVYRGSALGVDDILGLDVRYVAVGTGAKWRRDGVARRVLKPVAIADGAEVMTPDDIMAGRLPRSRSVLIYDDDHYYLGGVLAEHLSRAGYMVTLATTSPMVSAWTFMTMEQAFIQGRLIELGVIIECNRVLRSIERDCVQFSCAYTGRPHALEAGAVVLVTARLPETSLNDELMRRRVEWADAGLESATLIGDALAPATIAHAVYEGRRYAETLGETVDPDVVPFRREVAGLAAWG
jgi:dimethylamine/trimethylamine dehydrogenase